MAQTIKKSLSCRINNYDAIMFKNATYVIAQSETELVHPRLPILWGHPFCCNFPSPAEELNGTIACNVEVAKLRASHATKREGLARDWHPDIDSQHICCEPRGEPVCVLTHRGINAGCISV